MVLPTNEQQNRLDIESQHTAAAQHEHHVLQWNDITLKVPHKGSSSEPILSHLSGHATSGDMIAIMGPSGAGKSTLLDIIAQRTHPTSGSIELDGTAKFSMRERAAYVEQDDALLGVLTVRETVTFAARLSLPPDTPLRDISGLVTDTLETLGLSRVANTLIGNPIQRGISGGQKRRVTVACAVVKSPEVLLLDELTSGLDSAAAAEVVEAVKDLTKRTNSITLCTIHQPSYETLSQFDKVLLLARGRTVFFGPVESLEAHFSLLGYPTPKHYNPADHAMALVNTDFSPVALSLAGESPTESCSGISSGEAEKVATPIDAPAERLASFLQAWQTKEASDPVITRQHIDVKPVGVLAGDTSSIENHLLMHRSTGFRRDVHRTWVLVQRTFLNYRRNLLNHGIRLAMYIGMSLMMAVIWIRLPKDDQRINDRLSVHFYGVAFLSFMSVAGIPSFLEERALFIRERANGLVGPGSFVLANTIVTLPFMFICALFFSLICYWAIGLHPGATAFWRFAFFLFIATVAAESQSVLVSAILPIFVGALAVASFMNGFWMSVGGYFIQTRNLPPFWRDWAHWIDYQTYAFASLVKNDFQGLVFTCQTLADGACQCSYPSSLIAQGKCAVSGRDVLNALEIGGIDLGLYTGILISIIVVYRLMLYLALVLRRR